MATSFAAADVNLNNATIGESPACRQAFVSLGLRRIIARLTADSAATSNTTLAPVSDLGFQVEAGRRYKFRYHLPCSANAAGGNKLDLNGGSATVTSIEATAVVATATATADVKVRVTALNTSIPSTAANTRVEIEGTLLASNTGTVVIQHAQNASNAAASTLFAGGTVEVEDISA